MANGSPIPMKTTFETRRGAAARRARITCSTISPTDRCRSNPAWPVAQNPQPIAHPAWDDTADGGPVAVVHQDGLDAVTVVQAPQPLDRLTVATAGPHLGVERGRQQIVEPFPERPRNVADVGDLGAVPVQRQPDLVGAVAGLVVEQGRDLGMRRVVAQRRRIAGRAAMGREAVHRSGSRR